MNHIFCFCRNIVNSVGELVQLSGKQKKCLLQLILSSRATETQLENGESQRKKKKSSKRDRGGGSGTRGTALDGYCWDKEMTRWVCVCVGGGGWGGGGSVRERLLYTII